MKRINNKLINSTYNGKISTKKHNKKKLLRKFTRQYNLIRKQIIKIYKLRINPSDFYFTIGLYKQLAKELYDKIQILKDNI